MQRSLRELYHYCEEHSTPPNAALLALERETHLKTLSPQMMSGRLQGQFLRILSLLIQPQVILEIGTFTGYASICLAEGLAPGGVLHSIEPNREIGHLADKYLREAGWREKVHLHQGRAEDILPTLDFQIDLAFIDGGKQDYAQHYELVMEKLKPGGLILVDNTLWDGKVTQEKKDKDTQILHHFNELVQNDPRVENVLLPLRDGLLLVRKLKFG
jgi:caffeoyl-CoA O-methyltransferase